MRYSRSYREFAGKWGALTPKERRGELKRFVLSEIRRHEPDADGATAFVISTEEGYLLNQIFMMLQEHPLPTEETAEEVTSV